MMMMMMMMVMGCACTELTYLHALAVDAPIHGTIYYIRFCSSESRFAIAHSSPGIPCIVAAASSWCPQQREALALVERSSRLWKSCQLQGMTASRLTNCMIKRHVC